MSIFGAPKPAENKFGTLFGSTTAPAGGLFGSSQQQQQQQQQPAPSTSLFGSQQQKPQGGSIFQNPATTQNAGSSVFGGGASTQQQQQSNQSFGVFGGLVQPAPQLPPGLASTLREQQKQQAFPELGQVSVNAANQYGTKSAVEQMTIIKQKWDPNHKDCVFQYYFYNQVQEDHVPFYGPQPYEDPKKWEEALSKKPDARSIPMVVRGFKELGLRISYQVLAIQKLQERLHQVNNSLSKMKDMHELEVASRITEARRKHIVFTQRCLALATKIQILRNRGYAMDSAEEELKKKLVELEKKTFDPVLGGRQEEIWARMSGVRERARILQEETEKVGKTVEKQQNGELLSEDEQKHLEKLLKGYDKQLEHLKNMVDETKKEYDEWEKSKDTGSGAASRR